ncbi:MAG TPA: hypothetical protein VD905_18045 [Flavobacteriales bacterium]|nr:hypothetical protein [Flavobacteriales bacterium]
MSKTLNTSVLALALLFFLLKNTMRYSPSWVNIVNDIIAVPGFLVVLTGILKFLYGNRFTMNTRYAFATFATVSILFEGVFPIISPHVTADMLDIIWYFTGTILFIAFRLRSGMLRWNSATKLL